MNICPKDQSYIKISNTNMILDILLDKHPLSRSEVSKLAGISPASVTRFVNDLISLNLIREIKDSHHQESSVGRKAVSLDIIPDSLFTVGIQVGIDDITVYIMDLSSAVAASATEACRVEGLPLDELARLCLSIYQKTIMTNRINPLKIIGMCVAFSALTDPGTGELLLSSQFNWEQQNVLKKFEHIFCLPATIENDEKACLIGESHLQNLQNSANLAVISFGAGMGCASTSEGFLVRGFRNSAGEIGHIVVDSTDSMECNCGRKGCLHTHIAIPFLLKRAQTYDPSVSTIMDLRNAYIDGVPWAKDIINSCVEHIRLSLEIIFAMYAPVKIIIFGTLFHYLGDILPDLILDAMSPPLVKNDEERILFSSCNNQSCSIGCAHIARKTFIKKFLEEQL